MRLTGLIALLLFPPWRQCDELKYELERLYRRAPVERVAPGVTLSPVATPVLPEPVHFILPTGSEVVSGWYYMDPRFPADGPQHTGIDYACLEGEPIYAATSGWVRAMWNGDCGNEVAIYHGEYTSYYCHLSAFGVGGWVRQGAVIGYCGNTGLSTGAHLHFEVHHDGALVDPLGLP